MVGTMNKFHQNSIFVYLCRNHLHSWIDLAPSDIKDKLYICLFQEVFHYLHIYLHHRILGLFYNNRLDNFSKYRFLIIFSYSYRSQMNMIKDPIFVCMLHTMCNFHLSVQFHLQSRLVVYSLHHLSYMYNLDNKCMYHHYLRFDWHYRYQLCRYMNWLSWCIMDIVSIFRFQAISRWSWFHSHQHSKFLHHFCICKVDRLCNTHPSTVLSLGRKYLAHMCIHLSFSHIFHNKNTLLMYSILSCHHILIFDMFGYQFS